MRLADYIDLIPLLISVGGIIYSYYLNNQVLDKYFVIDLITLIISFTNIFIENIWIISKIFSNSV
jgi:hypothetical protein